MKTVFGTFNFTPLSEKELEAIYTQTPEQRETFLAEVKKREEEWCEAVNAWRK